MWLFTWKTHDNEKNVTNDKKVDYVGWLSNQHTKIYYSNNSQLEDIMEEKNPFIIAMEFQTQRIKPRNVDKLRRKNLENSMKHQYKTGIWWLNVKNMKIFLMLM